MPKESTKESWRHGDYGKKASIAHFVGGARYVARTLIGKISLAIVRAPNSPFSAVKMGGPFSLRRLSPLGSPAGGAGQTQMAALGMLRVAGVVSQREETGLFFFCVCRYPCINNTAWDASMRLGYFCNAKCQRDFKSTLAFCVAKISKLQRSIPSTAI